MSTSLAQISQKIRQRTGWTQQQLADHLLLSRNYIAQIESGIKDGSVRVLRDMQKLWSTVEKEVPERSPGKQVQEEAGDYGYSAGQPNAEDCINYLREYLQRGEQIKGIAGHTWIQLHRYFPFDEIHQFSIRKEEIETPKLPRRSL